MTIKLSLTLEEEEIKIMGVETPEEGSMSTSEIASLEKIRKLIDGEYDQKEVPKKSRGSYKKKRVTCSVSSCTRNPHAEGLCISHYHEKGGKQEEQKPEETEEPHEAAKKDLSTEEMCSTVGCLNKIYLEGKCSKHWDRRREK